MSLTVRTNQKALGAFVVAPSGQINGQTYDVLEDELDQLLAQNPNLIALDLAEVDYLSSAGIRVILKTQKALKARDGKLVFMHLQPQIRKVFEIIEALPTMRVFKNFEEMDDYLDRIQKRITGEIKDDD
ncbi:MAG: STAS domain-containing protein [Desulfobacterales bacterium]|nr:STAS domain-containing protein [Desulfobacterales bacterium]MDJ0873786.1 STAS domain-containing protein [Desulfobacterales bacterium]MDJ0883483.1 STAS domain-containing protein [Desulfobacterales bacterium]